MKWELYTLYSGFLWWPQEYPPPSTANQSLPPSLYQSIKPFIRFAFLPLSGAVRPSLEVRKPFDFHAEKGIRYKLIYGTWTFFTIDDWDDKGYVREAISSQYAPTSWLHPHVWPSAGHVRDQSLSMVLKGLTDLVLCPNRPITWHLIQTQGHSQFLQ